jgi:hypothetical protein
MVSAKPNATKLGNPMVFIIAELYQTRRYGVSFFNQIVVAKIRLGGRRHGSSIGSRLSRRRGVLSGLGRVAKELNQQCAHPFRLFLLDPMPGAIQKVKTHHA